MQELTKPTKERNRPKQADRQAERSKADRKKNMSKHYQKPIDMFNKQDVTVYLTYIKIFKY